MFDQASENSPASYLVRHEPDLPILFFSARQLRAAARKFIDGFPGLVSYAVKANPAREVLAELEEAGVTAWDVASPAEMALVRSIDRDAVLHYNNPIRSAAEIEAARIHGIASGSVDDHAGLAKLAPLGCEIAVRFRLPVAGAAYDFGAKFGADPDLASDLLREVARCGLTPALTFHPGTQCESEEAWAVYIHEAARIATNAGVELARLNVGGGFPAHRIGNAPELDAFFARIDREATAAFGDARPALVCEPGRAMVAESFTLATRVKAIREDGTVFLNDGIYGGLSELRDIGIIDRLRVVAANGDLRTDRSSQRAVFGPTCDSLDCLPGRLPLPEDLAEGDYVLFDGMGAYSLALSTRFNGYGLDAPLRIDRLTP